MKTKHVFLSAVLAGLLAVPVFAQYGTDKNTSGSGSQSHQHSTMMGKPVHEATVQGTHIRVWVMSDAEHEKMMDTKGMKDSAGMNDRGGRMGTDNRSGSDRMGTGTGTDRTGTGTGIGTGTDRSGTGSTGTGTGIGTDRRGTGTVTGTGTGVGTGSTGTGTGSMGTNRSGSGTSGSSGSGTYHVVVEATDGSSSSRPMSDISGTVQVTSPSMKTTSADLKPMGDHYDAQVDLDEKGQYSFTLNLTVDGTSKTTQFQYTPGSTGRSNNR